MSAEGRGKPEGDLGRPPAEIHVSAADVRALLEASCPDLCGETLRPVDEGWDDVTFRLGEHHAVRLPRRRAAVALLLNEQRWLPSLAAGLPLAVPVPVHAGEPSETFPWPWSLVPWISGGTAEDHAFGRGDAEILADTLRALHRPCPDDAPVNEVRGGPLAARDDAVQARLRHLRDHPGVYADPLRAIWLDALDAPPSARRVWLHGDLHPRNVIVRDGSLAGLIDWGDLNGGDPATDLACAWTLVEEPGTRRELLDACDAPEATVRRAAGWAVYMGLALLASEEARHVPLGLRTLERVLTDILA